MLPRRAAVLAVVALIAVLAAGLYAWRSQQGAHLPQGTGTALVGGPFELTNQDGKRVTDRDFHGRYMLVFFGYTFCPDVCPTTLQLMTQALDKMGPAAKDIQPVFITIDPARDTPEVLKSYVANFGPQLVGLTGSDADIAAVARAYRVYYRKADGSDAKNYLMDHSSIMYLMGRDGTFVTHFTYTTDVDKLAADITAAVGGN